ncbi:hypothetical protein HY992_05245 [Candidatus Micrarchaeota archaeon]|nr:hypothetical protein [Candidatus Micrarchaeota archaeon]
MAEIIKEKDAERLMRDIGVEEYGVQAMKLKCFHRLVLLKNVRNAMANILKQEMLSTGGDAAVHADCVKCGVKTTDVLLMGTLKQYERMLEKMQLQIAEGKQTAKEIREALEK